MPYKWDSAIEWLEEKARSWSAEQLYQEVMTLAREVDPDTLQDMYQSDMDADGYFSEETDPEEEAAS